jgi:branched-chain amino acid transport system ATP-binding protein
LFVAFDMLRNEVSTVVVEHSLDLVLALADHAYVLERGSVIYEGLACPLLNDLDLRRRVLWL